MPPPANSGFLPERRRLLKHLGNLGLASILPLGTFIPATARSETWQNWSGGQKASPAHILYPDSEEALSRGIRQAQGTIRAFGGGHSYSAVVPVPASGTLISLEAMNGLVSQDASRLTATFFAGTRIAATGPALKGIGQGLLNQPDIDLQSLGGAISTATHGNGRQLRCLSANITALRLVLADGSIVSCSPDKNRDLFEAARVGVGSIGVLSQITLQNRADYRLREQVTVLPTDEAVMLMQKERDQHRHIEFFAFPHGNRALVKRINLTTSPPTAPIEPSIDENALVEFAAESARKWPWINPYLQQVVGMFVADTVRIADSFAIFPSVRAVQVNEMEYSVPAEHGLECFEEIIATIRKHDVPVFFPLEFRYTKSDDCWLSPFYGRDSASISLHQYHKQDYRPYFNLIEPIFHKYKGRPHWGKLHSLKAPQLRALYPRFDDFLRIRAQADPQGRFLNNHARAIFLG